MERLPPIPPIPGPQGMDSFTWRANGVQSSTNYYSNTRQVTLDIGDAPLPLISSALTKSATVGQGLRRTITTTGNARTVP